MTTKRMSAGLAFNPERDLATFADLARQGQRLSGIAYSGHGWEFTDAEPEDAIFDMAYEESAPEHYFAFFAAAGWERVLSAGSIHIFKAAPGTQPVHTGATSRREEALRMRNRYALYSAVAIAVFCLVMTGLNFVNWHPYVKGAIGLVVVMPVVYTVVPLVGFWWRSRPTRQLA